MKKITKLTEVDTTALRGREKKTHTLAENRLKLTVKVIKQKHPELIYALDKMELVPVEEEVGISTDGCRLIYNAKFVAMDTLHRQTPEGYIMHILMHGLLGHFELDERYKKDKLLAWRLMDMAVNYLGSELFGMENYNYCVSGRTKDGADATQTERELSPNGLKVGGGRAAFPHKTYMAALENEKTCRLIKRRAACIEKDNHYVWNLSEESNKKADASDNKDEQPFGARKDLIKVTAEEIRELWEGAREFAGIDKNVVLAAWKGGKNQGNIPGDSNEIVREAKGDGLDYSDMLEEFMQISENPDEDPESLDLMLYQYGLDMYDDVPLIEPKEEGDAKSLNTVAIAIDTSGSCAGVPLSAFLRDTRKLLETAAGRFKFDEILVIECDMNLQKEYRIQEPSEIDMITPDMRFFGFGGTDFRPVFKRVEELEKNGSKISAVIYFSDSYGTFPKKSRENTYFVIGEENFENNSYKPLNSDIPKWVKVVKLPTGIRADYF